MLNRAQSADPHDVMDTHDAAAYWGVCVKTLTMLAKSGEVPAFRVGRQWRFSRRKLDEFAAEQSAGNVRDERTSASREKGPPRERRAQ